MKEDTLMTDISALIAQNRQTREAQDAAQTQAQAQAQAKAEKKAAIFTTLDSLIEAANQGYAAKDWSKRDQACVRILALTRYHLRQGGKAKFRLRIVWYGCQAYAKLGPVQVKERLEAFEAELLRHLADIPEMPGWVGIALKNIQERALKASNLGQGVHKTVARSVDGNSQGKPVAKKKPAQKPGKAHDRRRPAAQERLDNRFGDGPILVASTAETGDSAMAHALKEVGLNGSAQLADAAAAPSEAIAA